MRRIVSFTVFPAGTTSDPKSSLTQVPKNVFEKITSLYPEGFKKRAFFLSLPSSDERAILVRNTLTEAGIVERGAKFGSAGGCYLAVTHTDEYELGDFGHHDWYEVYPSRALADYLSRNEQGLIRNLGDRDFMLSDEENADLLAGKHDARGKIPSWAYDMVTGVGASRIMGTQVNELLASAKFHIPTKPTTVFGLFEWDPQVIFPILSAQCKFCDPKGIPIPIDGDRSYGMMVDGFIQSPVLKYDRSAVEQVLAQHGEPDVAKTREHFGNGPEVADPIILASRRLTAWLMSHDKKLSWKPVEII